MTVYLDTSALVKRYVREPGTPRVLTLWRQADHLATSRLTYAETVCAVRRKAAPSHAHRQLDEIATGPRCQPRSDRRSAACGAVGRT